LAGIPKPFPERVPIEDWSRRKEVQDRLTPYNFLYVEHLEVPHQGQERELHIPRRCMHCVNAPCTNLCHFGACQTEANGVTHIGQDVCFGGAKCKDVCPWKVPQRQSGVGIYLHVMPELAGNGVMFKCHRCLPLLAKGQSPRCVEVCPEQVQSIGPRAAQLAKAEALARRMAVKDGAAEEKWSDYVYGLKENGGTGTIYVAPMPFAAINAALMKDHQDKAQEERAAAQQAGKKTARGGPSENFGRPHMGPVGSSMADAEKLTAALVIAPVAGLAAGLGRFLAKAVKLGRGTGTGGTAPRDEAPKQEGGRA
jgi:Fe-S-cluster-containing dehydrogenase component